MQLELHFKVTYPAVLRTLAAVDSRPVCLQHKPVCLSRDGIHLAAKLRDPE